MAIHIETKEYNENESFSIMPRWAFNDRTASGTAVECIAAPPAKYAIMILKVVVQNASTTTGVLTFKDGETAILPGMELRTGGHKIIDNVGIKLTEATALNLATTLNEAHSWAVKYRQVRVS